MELEKETALIETILFLESEPVSERSLANISQLSSEVVKKCIDALKERLAEKSSGI